ncbi:MAG: hypothetical protein M9941_15630 [Anaerolineae bacterium]|nr:hypothetical protein [Anaerolineae bacterium]MCO5199175.1 hypothetical protein [Anaerolineae bacterium]
MTDLRIDIHRLASHRWLRALIITITLALSAFVAFRGDDLVNVLVVAVPVMLVVYWLLVKFPTLGPLLLVISGMLIPFEIALTQFSSVNASMLLLGVIGGVWILDMIIVRKEITFHSDRVFVPLLLLILVTTLSLLTGQLNWFSIEGAPLSGQLAGYGLYLMVAAAFVLSTHLVRSERGLQWMVWVFLAVASVYLVGRVIPSLTIHAFNLFPRNAFGSVFWIWVFALSGSQALFNRALSLPARVALGIIFGASLYISFGPGLSWASGWVPAIVVVAILVGLKSPRLLIPVGLVVSLIVMMNLQTLLNEFWLGLSHEHYSASTRVAAWQIVLQIAGKNPVWGLGPANYYYYTPLYNLLGYRVQFNSHSQYVDMIAQIGIVGLVLFVWFMAEIGRIGIRLTHSKRSEFERAYVYGALAALVAMFVSGFLGDWLIPFVYNITLGGFRASVIGWVFLGALVAIKYNYGRD